MQRPRRFCLPRSPTCASFLSQLSDFDWWKTLSRFAKLLSACYMFFLKCSIVLEFVSFDALSFFLQCPALVINAQPKNIKETVCATVVIKIVTCRGLLKGIRELVREGSNNVEFDYLTQSSKAYSKLHAHVHTESTGITTVYGSFKYFSWNNPFKGDPSVRYSIAWIFLIFTP
jgi:hypothetical protein